MKTGWWTRYKVNRPLYPREQQEVLSRESRKGAKPDQWFGLVRFNSTYIDWIDDRFRLRGMMDSAMGLVGFLFIAIFSAGTMVSGVYNSDPSSLIVIIPGIALSMVMYIGMMRFELSTYVYYPIRFNRKTRMVHVFRRDGEGGTLSVPWDQVLFHIGHDPQNDAVMNIRGEIMDGDKIKQTFAVGNDSDRLEGIYGQWEFIRAYMEEGADALIATQKLRAVDLSVKPSWTNCRMMADVFTGVGQGNFLWFRVPLMYWFAATRWLIFKTCKQPAFPPEIQRESVVAPDDPNVWPVPDTIGQFD